MCFSATEKGGWTHFTWTTTRQSNFNGGAALLGTLEFWGDETCWASRLRSFRAKASPFYTTFRTRTYYVHHHETWVLGWESLVITRRHISVEKFWGVREITRIPPAGRRLLWEFAVSRELRNPLRMILIYAGNRQPHSISAAVDER